MKFLSAQCPKPHEAAEHDDLADRLRDHVDYLQPCVREEGKRPQACLDHVRGEGAEDNCQWQAGQQFQADEGLALHEPLRRAAATFNICLRWSAVAASQSFQIGSGSSGFLVSRSAGSHSSASAMPSRYS